VLALCATNCWISCLYMSLLFDGGGETGITNSDAALSKVNARMIMTKAVVPLNPPASGSESERLFRA
jgi:hypothetical protein